jgi:hypothetical protein
MNSTFLAISIPVFGAIIGFSYIHIKAMRRILLVCSLIAIVTSYVNYFCWNFRYQAYYTCLMISFDLPDSFKYTPVSKELKDTITDNDKVFKVEYKNYYVERNSQKISDLLTKERENEDYVQIHIDTVAFMFALCFGLTYLFDYIKKYNLKEENKKAPKKDV